MIRHALLFCLFFSSFAFSQNGLKEFYLRRSLKQDGQQYRFFVLDDNKHGVRFYDKKKFYFWYRSQHVMSTQGSSSGSLLHGKFEGFFNNDQLAQKGQFRKGLKQGEWNYWRESGTLRYTENWRHGHLRRQNWYTDEGAVHKTVRVSGKTTTLLSGDTLIIVRQKGRKEVHTIRDHNGDVIAEKIYYDTVLHGKSKTFENGKVTSTVVYENGEIVKNKEAETDSEKRESFFKNLFKRKEKSSEETPPKEKKPKEKKKQKGDKNEGDHPQS